jgi:hypothetical protein
MSYRCFPAAKIVIVFRPGNFFKLKKIKAAAFPQSLPPPAGGGRVPLIK